MGTRVDKLDKNLAVNTDAEGFVFHDVRKAPFRIYGLFEPQKEGFFLRMPEESAAKVSDAVALMNRFPSGGRIRFKTTANRIAVRGIMPDWHVGMNGPRARSGFDFYGREQGKYVFSGSVCPPVEHRGEAFCLVCSLKASAEPLRDITMYLPIANNISVLEIGIPEGETLEAGDAYTMQKPPVVYYGSSITMGFSASRASSQYEALISRRFDWDYINLGFSGNAKGEPEMAEYIAGLDMGLFVLDYDHNSPNAAHLKETQYRFYEIVRQKNPTLPIIMMSRPVANLDNGDDRARFEALKDNFERAKAAGDENLYFLSGCGIFLPGAEQDSSEDGCHPNDLGFYGMSVKVGNLIQEILEKTIDK